MLFAIDIGNTQIGLGVYTRGGWLARWRIRTVLGKTADEYGVLIRGLFAGHNFAPNDVERAVLTSVVPPLTPAFRELCTSLFGHPPLVVGPGVKTGLNIRTDRPSEVGADLVADAVAAYDRFRGSCIVVDFGTATTFTAVASPGVLLGVAIAPGLGTAARTLAEYAAQLPQVPLVVPKSALGKNTLHAMQSGLIFGFVGLVEELIRRLRAELEEQAHVIATGSYATLVSPLTSEVEVVDPWLTLDGLRLIAERNP